MTITQAEEAMQNPDSLEWFHNLWNRNANEYDFFDFAQRCGYDNLFKEFDHGWQFRTVLHDNFKAAVQEFIQLLWGGI